MTKKEVTDRVLRLVGKMENNTFLLPESWSDQIQLSKSKYKYRTYVGKRGSERYIIFERILNGRTNLSVMVRENSVEVSQIDIMDDFDVDKVYTFINAIYNDKHSFQNHAEGERKIREEISNAEEDISRLKTKLGKLKERLNDRKL